MILIREAYLEGITKVTDLVTVVQSRAIETGVRSEDFYLNPKSVYGYISLLRKKNLIT